MKSAVEPLGTTENIKAKSVQGVPLDTTPFFILLQIIDDKKQCKERCGSYPHIVCCSTLGLYIIILGCLQVAHLIRRVL